MIPEKNKSRFPVLVTLATDLVDNGQDVLDKIDFDELIK